MSIACMWWCYVCPTELIYTRNDEGRELLVKAKMKAFPFTFESQVKRQDRWQPSEQEILNGPIG